MKAVRLIAVLAVLLVCSAGPTAAQEEGAAPRTIKVQVKRYKDLNVDAVYQAALRGIRVDVRFTDTFDRRLPVPRGMERVDVGAASYLTALAFRTGTELICLVPGANLATLGKLLGIPQGVPIGPAALELPLILNPGQEITIEGTILGTVGGFKYVLVDAVNLGAFPPVPSQREVHLFWPTQAEPRIITEPGSWTFQFPCTHAEGETDSVSVVVQELSARQLDAQLASLQAQLEGLPGGRKVYGKYTPRVVYRYAGDGEVIDVDFTDQVQDVVDPLPPELASAPAIVGGVQVQVPIVRAFEMVNRPTILVPNSWPTLVQQAAGVVPGETVRVRGTVIGPRGVYNCVLVDFLSFPEQREEEETEDGKAWWVRVEWPGIERPFVYWDYGQYSLGGLPCQNVEGRVESLNVLVSRFREYELPQPPAPQAPEDAAPAPED